MTLGDAPRLRDVAFVARPVVLGVLGVPGPEVRFVDPLSRHIAAEVLAGLLDKPDEVLPARGARDHHVEAEVELEPDLWPVLVLRHLVEQIPHLVEMTVGQVGDATGGGEGLEGATDRVELLELLGGEVCHDGVAMRLEGHQALGRELTKRLSDRDSADAELVGEAVLPEAVTGAELARQDGLAQAGGHRFGECAVLTDERERRLQSSPCGNSTRGVVLASVSNLHYTRSLLAVKKTRVAVRKKRSVA